MTFVYECPLENPQTKTHKTFQRVQVPSCGAAGFTDASLTCGGVSFSFTGTWK